MFPLLSHVRLNTFSSPSPDSSVRNFDHGKENGLRTIELRQDDTKCYKGYKPTKQLNYLMNKVTLKQIIKTWIMTL